MMRLNRAILMIIVAWVYSSTVNAQCVNSIESSCGVYSSCFAKQCKCSDSVDEYLISFGENYCKAFLGEHDFSDAGKAWRNSTLRCLQESLVPIILFENDKSCDCAKVKSFAYSSHVGCYTQPNASVCDLPMQDIGLIAKTIIFDKAFISLMKDHADGYAQVKGVLEKCSITAKEEETRKKWQFYLKLIKGKVE
jgi:hypothetical protein